MKLLRRVLAWWRMRRWLDLPIERRVTVTYLADLNAPISRWERDAWGGKVEVPLAWSSR